MKTILYDFPIVENKEIFDEDLVKQTLQLEDFSKSAVLMRKTILRSSPITVRAMSDGVSIAEIENKQPLKM